VALRCFGVRHHGPGSARSLGRALEAWQPDLVLVEGPPEADGLVSLVVDPELVPPVALLAYVVDDPGRSAFWPFASFSPEWIALRWAVARDVAVRFCDLPAGRFLAISPEGPEVGLEWRGRRRDPIAELALAAGHGDPERWWEDVVEARGSDDASVFDAVAEAMAELRTPAAAHPEEAQREAAMRLAVRAAVKGGYQRIALVCGAWHVPALAQPFPAEAKDRAVLRPLAKVKVAAAWVPWATNQLARESGYGAGITSPGWYSHLYAEPHDPVPGWMTEASRVLREEGLDAPPAAAIDATRLAEALAALRRRPLPGLEEVTDATRATLCQGDELPLRLIHRRLLVGEGVGTVPASAPALPLVGDVRKAARKLRIPFSAARKLLELDLRVPTGLGRSHLLHRLRLLGVPWGVPTRNLTGTTGTFRETWYLEWQPGLEVALVQASVWGSTLGAAATAKAADQAWAAPTLPELTDLIQLTMLADLPDAVVHVVAALEVRAALAADVHHLMAAVPPLVQVLRYGSVRRTGVEAVRRVVDGMVARVAAGLDTACAALDDEAAAAAAQRLSSVDRALAVLAEPRHIVPWRAAVRVLAHDDDVHGEVGGRAARLLLDAHALSTEEASVLLGRALSPGEEAARAGAWVEGFLTGSGLILVHDDELWTLIDRWVSLLPEGRFVEVLPLLRRTVATFGTDERRSLGERARLGLAADQDAGGTVAGSHPLDGLDPARAELVAPTVHLLLGLDGEARP